MKVTMEHKIFMPSDEETRQLMENAWQDFCKEAGTAGMNVEAISLMHDIFLWGYCAGHNDTLTIIRDQMAVDRMASEGI